ncbi:MAG: MFS transporter [Candidatus Heimdallarchaeota archaeon]
MDRGTKEFERTVLRTSILFHWVIDASQALIPVVSPILKSAFKLSYFQLGALFGSFLITMVCFQVIAGWLADISDESDLMAFGIFLVFCSCFLFTVSSSFDQLIISSMIQGIGVSFYHPPSYTVLSRATNDSMRRTKTMGFAGSSGDIGNFIAFLSTGTLAIKFGWEVPFLFWGIISLSTLFIYLLFLRKCVRNLKTQLEPQKITLPHKEGWKYNKQVICFLIAYFVLGGAYRTFVNFSPLFLTEKAYLTADHAGIIFSGFIIGGATGSAISGFLNEKFGIKKTVIVEFLLVATFFLSLTRLSIQKQIPFLLVIYFLSGLMLFAIYPTIYSIASILSKSTERGQFYGQIMAFSFFGGFVFSFLDGKLADLYGITVVYFIGVIISIIGAISASQLGKKAY